MTNRLFCAAAAAFATFAVASGAQAQTYAGGRPVCLQNYAPVQYIECRYDSIAQCQATASGRSATCYVNPYFDPQQPPRSRRRY